MRGVAIPQHETGHAARNQAGVRDPRVVVLPEEKAVPEAVFYADEEQSVILEQSPNSAQKSQLGAARIPFQVPVPNPFKDAVRDHQVKAVLNQRQRRG